ncbi:facilitated trehalose transporter Tret1-like [Photinus pyralis]|uniref:facilitated trehalose transporter Tret1-like n=1 Tax=Photinus pyralis TaxID=7054 RepID=UPI0012675EA3|nr:facilitated trehalose transporter Tret1-like [Photinus pyralis]
MTKAIYQALATVSVTFGIISDGMHYGWSSPVLPILLSDKSPFEFHPRQIVWIEVWLLLGVLAGVPIADVAVKRYGGRKPILAANGLSVTAWIVIALAGTIKLVYLARFLAGLAARVASVGASLYIAEISDKRSRQWLNSVINVMMLLGVVIVYILVPLLPILTSSLIGVAFLLLQMVSFPCTPEPTRDSAEAQVLEEPLREGERITFGEFIKEENSLKTLLIVMCVSCWQQLAGFGVVVMNLHAILTDAHCEMNTDTVAVIFATFLVVATPLGVGLVPKLGSKALLLISSCGTGIVLLVFGVHLDNERQEEFNSWIPIVLVVLYALVFQLGLGLAPMTIAEELLPRNTQEIVKTISDSASVVVSIVMVVLYPLVSTFLGIGVPWYIFSVFTFLLYLFTLFRIPDTTK